MKRLLVVSLVLLAVTSSRSGPATAGALRDALCPESCAPFCSNRAVVDTTLSDESCYYHIGYDIPAGTLFGICGGSLGWCYVYFTQVRDDFIVEGLATGTPVSLTASLDFSASWWCGACLGGSSVSARLTEGSSNTSVWYSGCDYYSPDCDHQLDSTLTVTVSAIAGTPFRMAFGLHYQAGEAMATIEGAFHFAGLPPGGVIRSCNGYVQDSVPTRPVTWGRVKALYR